jgi:hypothetical protein
VVVNGEDIIHVRVEDQLLVFGDVVIYDHCGSMEYYGLFVIVE